MHRIAIVILFLSCNPSAAGEIKHLSVQHEQGIYTLDLNAVIEAEQSAIWDIVSDHEHIDRLSNIIRTSEIVQRTDNIIKRRLLIDACILFYCAQAVLVEDVKELDNKFIITTIDSTQSDFDSGNTQWQILPAGKDKTRIIYHHQSKPSFWIPPLIGPLLIKRKLYNETKETIKRLEELVV